MSKNAQKGFIENLLVIFHKNTLERKEKKQSHPLNNDLDKNVVKLLDRNGNMKIISSYHLKKGDIVIVEVGDIIPSDGEVIEGLALVDESAITGESVPVMKEAGGDSSSVICGTRLVSNWLKIRLTKSPIESCQSRIFSSTELDTM